MKIPFVLSLCAAVLVGAGVVALAEKKEPETWAGKKEASLKPLSDDAKEKIGAALPAKATAEAKAARKMLVFYRCEGFIHKSITYANHALEALGKKTGAFQTDLADEYAVFTKENLAQYDVVVFNNTTRLAFENDEQREALLGFLAAGKGVAGIHGASDNFYAWDKGAEMVGGQFNGHPWTQGGKWAFKLDDPAHPLNKAFAGEGFWHTDEIYQYKPETFVGAKKIRILVSLDMSKEKNTDVLKDKKFKKYAEQYGGAKWEVPVSWIREYQGGRVFYTNLGHREDTFENTAVLQHLLDGIQYAAGDLSADATPSAEANPGEPALAPAE